MIEGDFDDAGLGGEGGVGDVRQPDNEGKDDDQQDERGDVSAPAR